jgi:hypothetical protein
MNATTSTPQDTDVFDIESGMVVFASDGEKIGTVMNIAGFGSTKIRRAGAAETVELVTEAKSGGGYFNVDRRGVQGVPDVAPLCVPFHGIQEVVAGRGVILNDTIIEQLQRQRDPRPAKVMIEPAVRRRWFPKWLF